MSGIRVAVVVSAVTAVLFVGLGGWVTRFSLDSVVPLALIGACFGAVAAPEIEPSAFRYPAWWQVGCSVAACVLAALVLGAGVDGYLFAMAAGIAIGVLAPYWIRHVTGP